MKTLLLLGLSFALSAGVGVADASSACEPVGAPLTFTLTMWRAPSSGACEPSHESTVASTRCLLCSSS